MKAHSFDTPDIEMVKTDEQRAAVTCFRELPERTRQILWLRNQDGLSFKKIGAIVGLENSQTTKLYHQGIEELQRLMAERGW